MAILFSLILTLSLNNLCSQAIPDTKLTIKKYADAKFEYLVSLHWPQCISEDSFAYSVQYICQWMTGMYF